MKTQNKIPRHSNGGPLAAGGLLAALLCLSVLPTHAQIVLQEWVRLYQGSADGANQARALVVDPNGNICVSGFSAGGSNGFDYATIKYSSAGQPLWTNRYNGPAGHDDRATAIAVAANADVMVTGSSGDSNFSWDYATIKYSSAGQPLWTNRYNGPAGHDDLATAIAVDANGNVVVTGSSADSNYSWDYATIKYSGAGVPLWTNRYNGPAGHDDRATAIAVAVNGDVMVTGSSADSNYSWDYATIKYSSAGQPLWTNRFNGPAGHDDLATAIAVAANGDVMVTGSSADSNYSRDYVTIKYSGAGVPLWTNRYNGPAGHDDLATAIAVAANGDVMVTGSSADSNYSWDYATIKYSGAGVPLWTNRYNGPAGHDDRATAIAVAANGDALVTGYSYNTNYSWDCLTIKYSDAGVPLSTNRYNGPADGGDAGNAIAADAMDNVYVTGYSWNGTNDVYLTIKYSVSPPFRLVIQRIANQLVLSWTNAALQLQSASAPAGPFTNLPGATSPYTNPITGAQQYFRLNY